MKGGAALFRYRHAHPLGYRLLGYIVLCSSVLALLTTAIQLFSDYRVDVRGIDERLDQIERSYLNSLANSLWTFDVPQTKIAMDGILTLPDIKFLEIETPSGERYTSGTEPVTYAAITRAFPLDFLDGKNVVRVGTVKVSASLEGVYQRLRARMLLILITNGSKNFLTAVFILFIFQNLVTRHLGTMAEYARRLDLKHLDQPLVLQRKAHKSSVPDELDQVTSAINEMRVSLIAGVAESQRVETSLRMSDERLSLVLAASGTGTWDWDFAANTLVWSDRCLALFGIPVGTPMSYERFLQAVHPEDREHVDEAVLRAMDQREEYNVETRSVWPDKSEHWIVLRGGAFYDAAGYPVRMSGVALDITKRKRAEEQLQRANAQIAEILESITDAFTALDRQWRFTYVNERATQDSGLPREQMLGKCIWDLFPDLLGTEVYRQCQRVMTEGKGTHYELFVPSLGRWFENHVYATKEGISVYSRDVSDRKRAEEEIRTLNASLEQRVQDRTRELAESEKRFRTIYDTAPVSIWQEDWTDVIAAIDALRTQGVTDFAAYFRENPEFVTHALKSVIILDVNQWTLDMFAARDKGEMLASLGTVFATPDIVPRFVEELMAVAQGHTAFHTETARNTIKGDTIHCFLAISFPPPGSGSGNVLVSIIDISERKRAEEALRRSEERYRLLFDTALQGVVYQDASGRIISINPAALRILGKSSEEILGSTSMDLELETMREDGSLFPWKEQPSMVALRSGHEVRDVVMGVRNPREQARRWINIRAVPLVHEGEDNPHLVYVIFDDITERRRTERQIRRQTEILTGINRIFHETLTCKTDAEVASVFLDVTRNLTGSHLGFINEIDAADHLNGITLTNSRDHSMREACSVAQDELALCAYLDPKNYRERVVTTGCSQIINHPDSGPDSRGAQEGNPPIRRFLGVPLLESGETIGLVGLANKDCDYTEEDQRAVEAIAPAFVEALSRKRAQRAIEHLNEQLAIRARALEEANKELESFSYSVSHDLRAPLRSMDGFSRILLEDYAGKLDDEGIRSLLTICAASQRMGQLIDDLLQLSRITRSEMRNAPIDLSALARVVADELQTTEPDRCVEFVVERDLIAQADAHLMRIVLENLFGNAWKFTSQQRAARIEFGKTTHKGVPAYFVKDNGVGFDMAYSHKLFGAFQRLHNTTEFPGTGIGLATVQRVIHRHGGQVWAEGETGHGAVFFFTLGTEMKPV